MTVPKPTLLIACGALAREILQLIHENGWEGLQLECLPADLHNEPHLIPDLMRAKIRAAKSTHKYTKILALYGDCGTGGLLDAVLEEEQVERIQGAHCYEFYSTPKLFHDLTEQEIGSFYLTDYLVRFFDRLVIQGLGIDRHPELRDVYFANYKRVVYLAQSDDPTLEHLAEQAARKLGLEYVLQKTGFGDIPGFLRDKTQEARPWHS